MSERSSTAEPMFCSGDMYGGVPPIMALGAGFRAAAGRCPVVALLDTTVVAVRKIMAMPKSRIFTDPSSVTWMFPGLRSPWMTPCSCAARTAAASWRAMVTAWLVESRSRRMRADKLSPATYSMTMNARGPWSII